MFLVPSNVDDTERYLPMVIAPEKKPSLFQ